MGMAHSVLLDEKGNRLELVLYKHDACGYCHRVMAAMRELNLEFPMRDVRREPQAYPEVIRAGGLAQVPMLLVNGEAMYESADIIRFLRTLRVAPAN